LITPSRRGLRLLPIQGCQRCSILRNSERAPTMVFDPPPHPQHRHHQFYYGRADAMTLIKANILARKAMGRNIETPGRSRAGQ
jgi:hypothetical protein